jgi:hypothetical protein
MVERWGRTGTRDLRSFKREWEPPHCKAGLVLSTVANCASGMVTPNQTVKSYGSSVFGGNVAAGFNIKVGDPSYRVYIEPRYHYAPTKNVTTRLTVMTLGIRY